MNDFTNNIAKYSNVFANNKSLCEWVITVSRESKYKLKITVNDYGVFNVGGTKISTEQEAERFYVDYMEHKSERTSMVTYKGSNFCNEFI